VTRRRAVFLDRDGVLNESVVGRDGIPRPPAGLDQFVLMRGVDAACRELHALGFLLVVVSNQPDVARGTQQREVVETINTRLREMIPLDDIRVCYHDDRDDCDCRKPRPGMLLAAARDWDIDLAASYMIGDRWRDVEAGSRAGCVTVLIGNGSAQSMSSKPDASVPSLTEAAAWIAERTRLHHGPEGQSEDTGLELGIQIFADGADLAEIRRLAANPRITGFTTNPTLMRKAGVTDYESFARDTLSLIGNRPISFEVLADDFDEMERQALEIASWAPNIVVKIPISNTRGESSRALLVRLANGGVRVNVTALMTLEQVRLAADALAACPLGYVSVFAGRIADTGRDPVPLMAEAVSLLRPHPNLELIWASPREVLNVIQADAIGCHVITATPDILNKLQLIGRDLAAYSLETVRMFYTDAQRAGYAISMRRSDEAEPAAPPAATTLVAPWLPEEN